MAASFHRSLIEQSRARRDENTAEGATGIIPGNRRKVGRNWCGPPLRGASREPGKYHQFLWAVSQPFPVLRNWNCAARRESETASEPSQVHGQFRAMHQDSNLEGYGCYCMTRTQRFVRERGNTLQKARPTQSAGRAKGGSRRGAARDGNNPPAFRDWGGVANRHHPTASRTQPER